jgi:hypothetical protein
MLESPTINDSSGKQLHMMADDYSQTPLINASIKTVLSACFIAW